MFFFPFAVPCLLLRGWVSAGSYIQVYGETGTQCYADRIAYLWTPGLYQAAHAWRYLRRKRLQAAQKSLWCNPFKVSEHGRALAVSKFEHHLRTDLDLNEALWRLSGARLVCHCRPGEECHADIIRTVFREQFRDAHDRDEVNAKPPSAQVLNYMAKLREVPEQSDGSSADEGAPERRTGWVGYGPPMEVGVGNLSRELCDGQSLASPGRWSPEQRRYPQHEQWKAVVKLFENFANT